MFNKYTKEDIEKARKFDPSAPSSLIMYFTYPGIIALRRHRRAHKWYNRGFKKIAHLISYNTRKKTGIDIHPAAKIGRRVFIDHGMGVVIGQTSVIGNDVIIYQGVTLGAKVFEKVKRHPNIEDNVIIYANSMIIGDVTVGENSVISAQSYVSKDIPKNSLFIKSEIRKK